jgi:hypothetical protein
VESSCELGNEPSGSIKCWELPSGCTSCGLSSGTQLHRVRDSRFMRNEYDIQNRNLDMLLRALLIVSAILIILGEEIGPLLCRLVTQQLHIPN